MKTYIIVAVVILIGGGLIYWGIKTKNLPKVLAGIAAILAGLFGASLKKNSDLKKEVKKKDEEIAARKEAVKEVKDVQQQIKEIDKDTSGKPEKVDAPASGDSTERLNRLNSL